MIGRADALIHFIKYNLIGIVNTAVGYGIIFGAMYLLQASPVLANAAGYATGMVISFVLNRVWNFKSRAGLGSQALRFFFVMILAYFGNLVVLKALIDRAHVDPYVSQMIASIVFVIISFAINKSWVFAAHDRGWKG